ncbi:MAG: hsdS [Schlesneria sp.]|nr:hsdS [Schlesneria sp.]
MNRSHADIPPGWEIVRLADVVVPSAEKAEPSAFRDSKYIGLEHIASATNRIIGTGDATSVKSTKAVFRAGDVLYGKLRPYLNKVCRPNFGGVCSTDILVFPQMCELDSCYLLYFLSHQSTIDYATQNSNGINLPRIGATTLGEIEFPLAPLAEQRRIVSKVEALQDRSRKARETIAQVGPLLDQFRQSLLAAAFQGDLTANWRKRNPDIEPAANLLQLIRTERRQKWEQAELVKYDSKGKVPPENWQAKYKEPAPLTESESSHLSELPDNWVWAAADEVVEPGIDIVYGIVQPGPNLNEGVPYVRGLDIQDGEILVDQLWKTSAQIADKYCRSALQGGDVLLGIIRHTKVAIVPDALAGSNMGRATVRFRPSSVITTQYLAGTLTAPQTQNWLLGKSRGIDMPIINVVDVRRTPIALAPLSEQQAITELIDNWDPSFNELHKAYEASELALAQLDQSILTKAFRGELVPQNPNDEPASLLLEQISVSREQERKEKIKGLNNKTRLAMHQSVRETVKEWIKTVNGKPFTFDDLRQDIPGDYEELKDAIFALLDKQPELEQVFDESTSAMKFQRRGE